MIHHLELYFLAFARWYYESSAIIGLPVLLVAGWLMVAQFFKQNRAFVPGALAVTLFIIEMNHWFNAENMVKKINRTIDLRTTPGEYVAPFSDLVNWLFEPIFGFFVAPFELRFYHQEFIFVAILAYLANLAWVCFKEYKRTGVILGDISFKRLVTERDTDRPLRSELNELGSGDLATAEEINRWVKPSGEDSDTQLQVSDLRSGKGIVHRDATLYIPAGERNRHMLAIAKTGGGKTTKLILPVLYNDCLDPNRSTIVIDSKPEMWSYLANFVRKHNPEKEIMLFNPLDRTRSLSWNILGKIESDTDAKLIANTIVMATDNPQAKSDSPFFRNNALSLLNSIMVGLLNDPNDVLSMPRVHQLVQSGMKSLCDWLEAHPNAIRTSRSFVELARSGSQNADTIMSELAMRINAWDLADIRATTAFEEIDLKKLIDKPTLFIVELRESELEMLRPMANVIVIELLRYLTKQAESFPGNRLPRHIGFVIDEFASSLGRLPDIHVKLNTLRSRRVSIVAAVQSIAQIKANYGDDADSVIAGFSSKICMPNLDIQDAEWASKESGQMTVRFETASTGTNRKIVEWFASKNISSQEQVQQRAVLTPDEIGRPADGRNTFFLPDTQPFQGFLVPYYKIPKMLKDFDESQQGEVWSLRDSPIEYTEGDETKEAKGDGSGGSTDSPAAAPAASNGLPPGITDVRGMSDDDIWKKIEACREKLDWENTTGSARKWWQTFEDENKHRPALILRLAEELVNREATISEFFLSYVYSNTDNIQANLHYLDYSRLKKQEDGEKEEAA